MKYSLIVNDVQKAPEFTPAVTPALVRGIARVIEHALAHQNPIVFTEIPYWKITEPAYPPTETELTDLVQNYPQHMVIPKMVSDGSRNIQNFCDAMIDKSCFVLVGINTDVCVIETAIGLHGRYPSARIIVVRDACNSVTTVTTDKDAWAQYPQHPFIEIVESVQELTALGGAADSSAAA